MQSGRPIVLTDFPDQAGLHARQCFADPIAIVVAERHEDVSAALAQIEEHAARGYYAAGFVSYDAAPAFDRALRVCGRAPTPLLWFAIFDAPATANAAEPASRETRTDAAVQPPDLRPHVARSSYNESICAIQNGIRDGAFYQVNHTLRLRGEWAGDSPEAYDQLQRAQPNGYGMYVDTGRFQILSASPELFFSRTGREITTRPMKGTAARGRWLGEDAAVARQLASSEKDRAENVMIVDLVRNDLGRIADVGSVTVQSLFDLERHPTVWQMTSTITARLRREVRLPEIFGALFPSGSVVGAPKIAAASWIADHEGAPRGVYCGAMGVVRPGGDCTFNVAIRTVVVDAETRIAEYGAGGGITIDSTPEGEYMELLTKAAVLRSDSSAVELFETLRLVDGSYRRRDRHLRRLADSATYFGFAPVTQAANAALDDCARATPEGQHRVRLVITSDGVAQTRTTPIESPSDLVRPLRCAIARTPVSSLDPWLYHKTTRRAVYASRRAECLGADEVLMINERGELTECSIGNLVVEIDGGRLTPPRACGLLPGTFREELLEAGLVREQVVLPADLAHATRIWLVNSLREWVPLRLIDGSS